MEWQFFSSKIWNRAGDSVLPDAFGHSLPSVVVVDAVDVVAVRNAT